jgi:outer membrane receptor protein involved in Fe transport
VGDRTGNLYGSPLKDYATLDAFLSWETPDRRLQASVAAINLLDRDYELASGLPGPGRTFSATLKARF